MSIEIRGIGTAQPSARIGQDDAAAMAVHRCCSTEREAKLLTGLYRRTRVESRAATALCPGDHGGAGGSDGEARWAFYPPSAGPADRGPTTDQRMRRYIDEAIPLAAEACARALDDADLAAGDLTHLVTASCTGFAAPGVDIRLVERLGLRPTVTRSHVGFMGCHGAFNALQVGGAMAQAHAGAKVLVCAVELCSLHFGYGFDPQRVVANALFADGSGAVVLAQGEGADGRDGRWRLARTGSCLLPASTDAMTWHIRDHGFEMTLSPKVPDLIRAHLRPWLETWLAGSGLTPADVGAWAIHPGGPRVVESVEQTLDLPAEQGDVSRDVLRRCGNMSSATILFILERLMRRSAPRPCVALGFGPGLVAEAMLFV